MTVTELTEDELANHEHLLATTQPYADPTAEAVQRLGLVVVGKTLLAEVRRLRYELGLEKIIREGAQDTAKRLGNAIDAHEEAEHLTESCRFPWTKHGVWLKEATKGDPRQDA